MKGERGDSRAREYLLLILVPVSPSTCIPRGKHEREGGRYYPEPEVKGGGEVPTRKDLYLYPCPLGPFPCLFTTWKGGASLEHDLEGEKRSP